MDDLKLKDKDESLTLPNQDIHEREKWLWENPEAIASVKRGIQQAKEGATLDLGDFSQFVSELRFKN